VQAVSFLLSPTASLERTNPENLGKIASFLSKTMEDQHSVVGFAPGILGDADDTARALITLSRLGRATDPTQMLSRFEAHDHFRTYDLERNPSFSANCNVLIALLSIDTNEQYDAQIEKTADFLLREWDSGDIHDKWNTNPMYSAMLLTEAFVALMKRHSKVQVKTSRRGVILERIPAAICQILRGILENQQVNGSWGDSLEATSYSVIAISQCMSLPWDTAVRDLLCRACSAGRVYLSGTYLSTESNCYFWVEKTAYQSNVLKIAFCSLALHGKWETHQWPEIIVKSFQLADIDKAEMIHHMMKILPIFATTSFDSIALLSIEAMHASQQLKRARNTILNREDLHFSKDNYLDYISMIWLFCNHARSHVLPPRVVTEMILISLLNYQIDEFMESVVAELPTTALAALRSAVQDQCDLSSNSREGTADTGHLTSNDEPARKRKKLEEEASSPHNTHHSQDKVLQIVRNYISHFLQHPSVLQSPAIIRYQLSVELHNYLVAQITHNIDNVRFVHSRNRQRNDPTYVGYSSDDLSRSTFLKWVHSTGADDTSCPFAFLFFICLISSAGETCLGEDVKSQYIAQSLARHLAVMCRMYNDFGSVARDKEEDNLNSIDFAEFYRKPEMNGLRSEDPVLMAMNGNGIETITIPPSNVHRQILTMAQAKDDLMALAEYERSLMKAAFQSLGEAVRSTMVMERIQVFVDVTDTFGQMYVVKDIASRRQETGTVQTFQNSV
jgi:hypothetical protein